MKKREFRSDTMTLPTAKMREAIAAAEVGDDMCGEDPTVNRLEEMSAKLLGTEAAMFVPSGTFGNQCAIGSHIRPGEEVILSESAHVIEHEVGAISALWGALARCITPANGSYLTRDEIARRARLGDDIHEPRTGLIVVENALSDGNVLPIDEMRAIKQLAEEFCVPVHLDGARIFNAALSLGVDAAQIAQHADSIMFCISKGLGAPVGSLLCGTASFIERARKKRKMMGGSMRQAGILAAAGIVALEDGIPRLSEDHDNARLLASLLSDLDGIDLDLERVRINMVFCRVSKPGKTDAGLVAHLGTEGFDTYPAAAWGVRFVTSSEVNAQDVRDLAGAVDDYLRK